jgi:hypothetical protein
VPGTLGKLQNIHPASAASDPVIAAAGDIACGPADINYDGGLGTPSACRQLYTSNILVNGSYTAVLALGDNQYPCGTYASYEASYDPTWGRVKPITYPVPGNHEYGCSPTAAGYFQYFGWAAGQQGQGYYSFDLGAWHLIALNSQCAYIGGCAAGSPQYNWLQSDLAAHPNQCTLAYWHIPLFGSTTLKSPETQPLWQLLYDHQADVVLNGHSHTYERFAPQGPNGVLDNTQGIREFIVGTGGENHTGVATVAANSQVRNNTTFGILALTLHPASYDWKFVPESGTFTDSGSATCHDPAPVPSPPSNLTTTSVSPDQVGLDWSPDHTVSGYNVYRNGSQIATVKSSSYTDQSVSPQTSYSYYVTAYNSSGLTSSPSATLFVTTPSLATPTPSPTPAPPMQRQVLFSDGFESGKLARWTATRGLAIESSIVGGGRYAALGRSPNGHPGYAVKVLPSPQTDIYYHTEFDLLSLTKGNLNLLQFRSSSGLPLLTVRINYQGRLTYYDHATGTPVASAVSVTKGRWHNLRVRLHVAGASGQVEVLYDGVRIAGLTRTANFGSQPIAQLVLGETRSGLTYSVAFDNVWAFVLIPAAATAPESPGELAMHAPDSAVALAPFP